MGTFSRTDSEQRALDQESGRQEDAHRRTRERECEHGIPAGSCPPCLRAENVRLRALLARLVLDLNLDAASGLASPDARLRFARYVRDIRAALAAEKG